MQEDYRVNKVTKEKFIKDYREKSNISICELNKTNVILACDCGDKSCKGWAVVSNNPLSIKSHNELYNRN